MAPRHALAALAAAAAVLWGGAARADLSRVGVVIERRAELSEREADALASRLGRALSAHLEVDVIAGADVRRRLPPAGVARDCAAQQDCLRDLASRLDADELLLLSLARAGAVVRIDATWCDPDIDVVAERPALRLPSLAGPEAERALAAAPSRLLPHASPRHDGLGAAGYGPLALAPLPPRRRLTAPVVATGVVAVAALGAGVGFAIAARADYNQLEQDGCHREACAGAARRVDRMERRALAADLLFGTAAVAAAGSAILFFTTGGTRSRVTVGAAADADGALLSLVGAF